MLWPPHDAVTGTVATAACECPKSRMTGKGSLIFIREELLDLCITMHWEARPCFVPQKAWLR